MRSLWKFALWSIMILSPISWGVAQDMPLSQVLIEGESWELVGEGYKFTEGPAVDAKGQIYFTDIPNSKIYRIDLMGKVQVFVEDSQRTNGLMFGQNGKLYGCRMGSRQIVAYSQDGKFEVIADEVDPNDLVVDAQGGIYYTEPDQLRVGYINPEGKKEIVAEGFRPNGVILTADGGTLVVTDHYHPHLWTFRVEEDGKLKYRERYFQPLRLPSGEVKPPNTKRPGSDGLTVDKAGRVYVATRSGVQMFDPTGRMGGVILKPHPGPCSNVVFGGPSLNVLYATCGDKVFKRLTKTQGVRYTTKPR